MWPLVSLPSFCKPKQWPTISKSEFTSDGYPVYGANGKIGFHSTYNHEEPTVLITCRGATCGRVNVSEPKSYVNGNAMALDFLDEAKVHIKYLYYCLQNSDFDQIITGVAQPQITRQSLNRLQVPLPPLDEQKRIASILDAADELRAKRRESIAQLDALLQSTFLEMFGDPVFNPYNWEVSEIKNVISEKPINGAYYSKEAYVSNGTRMVHMADAFYGTANLAGMRRVDAPPQDIHKYGLFHSDILVSRRSLSYEGAAKPCMIPASSEPLIFESSLIRLRSNQSKLKPIYLFYFLQNERARSKYVLPLVTRSTISGINQKNLMQVNVLLPPIDLQERFVAIVESIEKQKAKMHSHLNELDSLFASLQHRAFTGEL
ncbi:type I restriction enzyme, S subunit [Kushneria avicenniae]|uniref:Type I restriction enzyme, S subunit n=1 Tax=Kushneria avicenniae TaxID=402385 RepID=A0A1I1JUR9_9GAMM|nr:restriction endonuclease subunit S [Kushneria avicenniae]SFC49543.1 type I restriction enzyme, S subunit [Kushneria avicenniae]